MTSKGREKMSEATIGIDVSKDHLDAHRLPTARLGSSPTPGVA
jgi:hypothetical protein